MGEFFLVVDFDFLILVPLAVQLAVQAEMALCVTI